MNLSAGDLRDILSSARAEDVLVSSGRTGVSGPSVSVAVNTSSLLQVVSDVRSLNPFPTPSIPSAPCHPVSSLF